MKRRLLKKIQYMLLTHDILEFICCCALQFLFVTVMQYPSCRFNVDSKKCCVNAKKFQKGNATVCNPVVAKMGDGQSIDFPRCFRNTKTNKVKNVEINNIMTEFTTVHVTIHITIMHVRYLIW